VGSTAPKTKKKKKKPSEYNVNSAKFKGEENEGGK
jgi:hypothetical protein